MILSLGGFMTAFLIMVITEPPNLHRLLPEPIHDIYSGIYNKEKLSCCNGSDCHFAFTEDRFIFKTQGGYILKSTGEQIDEGQVGFSPNQNYHICRFTSDGGNQIRKWKAGQIRCLLIPNGGV